MADLVLLGAGASVEAGVPATFDMTEQLASSMAARHVGAGLALDMVSALHFVCGALLQYDGATGASPFRGLDVERVFAAVGLLAERNVLEVSPFVTSWHPAVDAWEMPGPENTFAALARAMLVELRSLVATTAEQVRYLDPLIRAAGGRPGLTIATLNYDRTLEQAGAAAGLRVDTGMATWVHTGRWSWSSKGIRLLKLHGSIDWSWEDDTPQRGRLPSRYVVQSGDPELDDRPPVLVFGHRGKLRAEGPFLSLLAAFERHLSDADRLIVIGYSFRDDHVNEMIRRWTFDTRRRHRIVVVDPHATSTITGASPEFWRALVALQDEVASNHVNIAAGTTVEVLRVPASEAVATLF